VISSIAVSTLLLFDLEFDFVDFLVAVGVAVVRKPNTALAGRDRHDTY